MKKFNASDLSKKPSELWKAARYEGAIIQHKDRQGNVVEEFFLLPTHSEHVDSELILNFPDYKG